MGTLHYRLAWRSGKQRLKRYFGEVGLAPSLARQDLKTQDKTRSCLASWSCKTGKTWSVRRKLHVLVEGGRGLSG